MFGTRFFKRNKPMVEKAQNPEEEVNSDAESRVSVVVDQDGKFLRVELDGEELDHDLVEESVEKEEDEAVEEEGSDSEEEEAEEEESAEEEEKVVEVAPVAPLVAGDKCPACSGTGLENENKLCDECKGSGVVK
jgi:hypothetical protein